MPCPPFARDTRGATIVEFALLLPILVCLLMGIIGYGQYFLLAHSVQQIANDAARATVPGLSATERASLARQSVTDDVAALGQFAATRVSSRIDESGNSVAIQITLDGRGMAPFASAIVPLPSPVIARRAVVRRGGLT